MPVLLLDTYSLFFRAFHGLPPMNTASGLPTQATYGLSSLLLKLLREHAPSGLAFALDTPGGTFRHDALPEYKGTRAPLPSDLARQFAQLERLIEALGVPAFRVPGMEADDVLATLAQKLVERGEDVRVVTGDRDLLQLVSARVQVVFVGQRGGPAKLYDEAAVRERFGLSPAQLPDYVALVGDTSDNIPKVPGIGEVSARKLVAQYGGVDALLAEPERIRETKLREIVTAHAAQLQRNVLLTRLRADLELGDGPYALPVASEGFTRTRALFEELEFKSLVPRLDKLRGGSS